MPPCWRLWRRGMWLLQPLQGRLWYWGEEPDPQEEQATAPHTPVYPEEASESEGAISLGVMVDMWRQLRLTTPWLTNPLAIESGPPPLEDADSSVCIPRGALLHLTSLGSMHMIIMWNNMMGMLEYSYETRVISRTSPHLTSPIFPV